MRVICQCYSLWWKGTIVIRSWSQRIPRIFPQFWWKLKRHGEEPVSGFCWAATIKQWEEGNCNMVFSRNMGLFPQVKRLWGMYTLWSHVWNGLRNIPRLQTDAWGKKGFWSWSEKLSYLSNQVPVIKSSTTMGNTWSEQYLRNWIIILFLQVLNVWL